jgi:hypothetical protein
VTAPRFPPGRYGRRRERAAAPRWIVPALLCAVLAGALGLAVTGYRNQQGDVQAAVRSFSAGPAEVRVTFDVTRPDTRAVDCLVRARDRQGAEIGRALVRVAGGRRQVTVTHTLPTRGRPVTGEVFGCSRVKS